LSLTNSIVDMNEQLLQSMITRNKRTFDDIQEQFIVRDTGRRQKITTGDALFGHDDRS
jgi:hypothetical protein